MSKRKLIITLIGICFLITGCGNIEKKNTNHATNATTQPTKESFLNEPMTQPTPRVDLKAKDIEKLDILDKEVNPTKNIISNADGFLDQYKDFRMVIDSLVTDPDYTKEMYALWGEKEYYISLLPVRFWDAMNNEVNTSIESVLLFSKDMRYAGRYDFMFTDGQVSGDTFGNAEEDLIEVLRKSRDTIFIPVYNDGTTLLGPDNQMTKGIGNVKITVEGDYYAVLRSKGLGVSWNMLTNKDNLKLVKVNDWK